MQRNVMKLLWWNVMNPKINGTFIRKGFASRKALRIAIYNRLEESRESSRQHWQRRKTQRFLHTDLAEKCGRPIWESSGCLFIVRASIFIFTKPSLPVLWKTERNRFTLTSRREFLPLTVCYWSDVGTTRFFVFFSVLFLFCISVFLYFREI